MVNFALLWDTAMIVLLSLSKMSRVIDVIYFIIWIAWTKTVKLLPHFFRHPEDFPLMICQVAFAYIHSFFKLWALLTFWDCNWSGRNLDENNQEQDGLTPAEPWIFINNV